MHAVELVHFYCFPLPSLFFFLFFFNETHTCDGEERKSDTENFLQSIALGEVCCSSAWKQDGTPPGESCHCAELHLFKGCVFFEGQRERKGLGVQTTTLLLLVLLLFLCVKPPNLKPRVVYTNQLFISCGSNWFTGSCSCLFVINLQQWKSCFS